jgi:hypothetical protein
MTHLSDDTLNEYLDETLAPELKAEMDLHLAACELCASRLLELHVLFDELESLPELHLRVDLSAAIRARLVDGAPLPRPVRWLALTQSIVAIFTAILAWPLIEAFLQLMLLVSPTDIFAGATLLWLEATASLRWPEFTFEMPAWGFDPTSSSLVIVMAGVFILWVVANSLLIIPRSRRIL